MSSAWLRNHFLGREFVSKTELFEVSDLLHEGRTVLVTVGSIGPTVSSWLADLGVNSPLVDDLTQAVRSGDWPVAHALGEHLSVHVTVAA